MEWQMIASMIALTGMVGLAVWRFAKLESAVKNQHHCQHLLVKSVSRLNVRVKGLSDKFDKRIKSGV